MTAISAICIKEILGNTGTTTARSLYLLSGWNDCSIKQLLILYAIIMGREPNVNVKRIRVMTFLLQLSNADLKAMERHCIAEYGADDGPDAYLEQIEILCQKVADPFFNIEVDKEGNRKYSIALTLTKCPYPSLEYTTKKKERRRLYASADGFDNMDIDELSQVFTLTEALFQQHDAGILNRLLATIWRMPKDRTAENLKSGYQGDIRRPLLYEEGMVERRAKYFEQVPDEVKQIMLHWITSCRATIIADWPIIFTQEKKPAQIGEKEYGWAGLLLQLAKGPNVDAIARTRWGNVFVYLAMLEDERKLRELQTARG